MIGTWHGVVTTPWVPPYRVEVTFEEDGHYSAHCLDDACQVAFYYGTDDDSPAKTYEVNDVLANCRGRGRIIIVFGLGNTNIGELDAIVVGSEERALRFEFWHRGSYGPLEFDLERVEGPT